MRAVDAPAASGGERVRPVSGPLLPLPGFMPDAVGFGLRLAAAMVLAYGASFAIQLDGAASAGVCVAIVMQPSPGMAMNKARFDRLPPDVQKIFREVAVEYEKRFAEAQSSTAAGLLQTSSRQPNTTIESLSILNVLYRAVRPVSIRTAGLSANSMGC